MIYPGHTTGVREERKTTEDSSKTMNKQAKRWAKDLKRHFSKEDINGQQPYGKISMSLIIGEMKIKITMRYPCTPVQMAVLEKTNGNKNC